MKSLFDSESYQQTEDAMLRLGLDPNLYSTNATCNQLMESLKQPTCQPQQESGFPMDKRVKRLIRKTQKAMEAAEIEHLFSPVKKSKKRKTRTLPLSVKPTRLIGRIPLLEERGAEMATNVVEGKENNVLVNCNPESGMDMRNEAREREERGKEGEKMLRSKLIVRIPLLEKCGAEMSTDVVEGKENNVPVNCNPEFTMAMRNEAREWKERGKEREKLQKYKLIVRIPLLEKCGSEMSTDVVEGKENNVPVNCNPEFTMAMRNVARERKERGKEGEKLQNSKLIVRIPLLEKCGAEMSTDVVEGKENSIPVNYNPEFTMAMRNEARERKERGKEGEKLQKSKLLWNPVAEVDITPNYRSLPVEDLEPPSTNQTDLERSVLNDRVRLVHRDTNYHRALNDHEKNLLENEDKRFELDMLLEIVRSTIKKVEVWISDMNCGSVKPIESYLSGGNQRCIEKLYGDRGVEMMGLLKKKPDSALPIILKRLREKFKEVDNYHTDFNHT